jgi:tetratricopeptide (TPR) repeat protein
MATISQALAIAIQHHQAGRLQPAEQIYRQIVAVEPNHAEAWHLLGVIAYQRGEHAIAVEHIERAIGLNATHAAFPNTLGAVYRALHRIPEALACYRRALELKPDYAEAHFNLGIALSHLGKLDDAIACYRRAVELKPDYAEAFINLSVALRDRGLLDDAIACCRRTLELKPDYAEAHGNLGNALRDQGKLDEAVACYRRTLELKPDSAEAHNNLGATLRDQGRPDEALACHRRALELKPDYAEAHNNLGAALNDQGNTDEALACYRRALELKPDLAYAHWNQSLTSLTSGDFQRGWAEYPWRWKTKQFPRRDLSQPLWDGQPLEGKTILLHVEQGLGDAIQFIRYAPLVKQRGGVVMVECPRPIMSLLASCAGIDRLVERGAELPPFDVRTPLDETLPYIFRTALGDIPAAIPYLFADPGLVQRRRQELDRPAGFKIGIAWQGRPTHPNDRNRSIPLGCFEPLARCSGVRLLSLQKGAGVEQLQHAAGQFPIAELGSRLEDFMDTAAVMRSLDLVIACDTAVVHLAGALGVPVWVALPFIPDWRWLLGRSGSPWYPTMRLFRQDRRGDWQDVFRRIEIALGDHVAGGAMPDRVDSSLGCAEE